MKKMAHTCQSLILFFIRDIRNSPRKALRRLNNTIKILHQASKRYHSSYIRLLKHAADLTLDRRFLLEEAYSLGILDPRLPDSELTQYCSTAQMQTIQKSISPWNWGSAFLENKAFFYRFCAALGVPIPKLYALFFKETAGWASNGSILANRAHWVSFFNLKLPSEFVIKPTPATHGEGLNVFSRSAKGFVDALGKFYTAEDLYETLVSNPKWSCFVVQERLTNISELVHLSDTPYLQTIRMTTFVAENGECYIIYAYLRPIVGQNIIDNHYSGLTGNLIARVSLNDGVLHSAVFRDQDGSGFKTVRAHPKTKVIFEGFQLPLWQDTCDLVKETALKFLPIRTVGWDVALTPNGIFIVEGNFRYAPPNSIKFADKLLARLSAG